MSVDTVLYDVPGPRARRRALIGTVVGALVLLALLGVAVKRLADEGQLDWELWSPLINPNDDVFSRVWELLGSALLTTLMAAAVSVALSLLVGSLLGVARMMLPPFFKAPVIVWIELFRGLPVVITIIMVWRIFVESGVDISWLPGEDGFWYLVVGLTLYNSVIIAEILRAGVASLPSGQGEAARAVGMRETQVMGSILLPQAYRIMLPALISQLVVVVKDTSLVAVAGGFLLELLRQGNLLGQTLDNTLQVLLVVGAIYILINYALSRFAVWLERRLSRSRTSPHLDTMAIESGVGGGGGDGG